MKEKSELPNATHRAAARVASFRRALGITQEQLSIRAGVHWNTIRFLESGRVSRVRVDTLSKIANALGVDIVLLLAEHTTPPVSLAPDPPRSQRKHKRNPAL